jgi:hypothetical protein
MKNIGCCGINCDGCKSKLASECKGCKETKGNVFWGECQLYFCCKSKSIDNCGKSDSFPCAKLKDALNGEGANDALENLKE